MPLHFILQKVGVLYLPNLSGTRGYDRQFIGELKASESFVSLSSLQEKEAVALVESCIHRNQTAESLAIEKFYAGIKESKKDFFRNIQHFLAINIILILALLIIVHLFSQAKKRRQRKK